MTPATSESSPAKPGRSYFHHLLHNWAQAIVADDADRIEAFVEPDWELISPGSGPIPLDRFLSAVRSGLLSHSQMKFEVCSVRLYEDTAIVLARGTNRGSYNGDAFTADEWVTELFVQRHAGWRCALSALTPAGG